MKPESKLLTRPTMGKSVTIMAAAALALGAFRTLAQTWQTVDDFQYVAGHYAVNFGLAVAPSGVVFASGFASDGSTDHGLVMASADDGNTWSAPLDDFVYPGSVTRHDGGIVADAAGNLNVSGRYYFSTGNFHQYVRRSIDGGVTWSTVDDLAIGNAVASPLAAGHITADLAGNVYVTEPIPNTWTIRKGTAGTTFSTVDAFQPGSSQAEAVFASPRAGVFAVGYGTILNKKTSSQAWIVRRSLDGGATWTTVDTYQASGGAAAYGAGADAHGDIYVVGRAVMNRNATNNGHWQVRKSTNGGSSWSTVDDYQLFSSGNQVALGFAADSNGNLFVSGWASVGIGTGPYHWIVRESSGGAGAWMTVDDFTDGSNAMAHAIAADSLGHAFVGGQGAGSGWWDWVLRKN